MLFHEIYPPLFEKGKVIEAHHRSGLQLMSVINCNEDLQSVEGKCKNTFYP